METFVHIAAVLTGAGSIGLMLATIAVSRLKRDPGIYIERGKPQMSHMKGERYFQDSVAGKRANG